MASGLTSSYRSIDDENRGESDWSDEGEGHTITVEQLAELCNDYFVPFGEEPNWGLVDDRDAIGIQLTSGD